MGLNLTKAWAVAQAVLNLADASARAFGPPQQTLPPPRSTDLAPTMGGLGGQLEARLTGVVVSALKEAFDREAARTDLEREAIDDQRRRAEESLRLELVRQSGDHALSRLRTIGAAALLVWVVSVVFAMRFPEGLAGVGRIALGLGWLSLLGAVGVSFVAHSQVSRWVARAQATKAGPDDIPEGGVVAAAPWLVVAGLAFVAISLLVALG
jgi:hypothetical protein